MKAIEFARSEYEATLRLIANLEQDLLGKESSRHQKLSASIERMIPTDQPFTIPDILKALEAADPARAWRQHSIQNHLTQLRERGLIERVKNAKATAFITERAEAIGWDTSYYSPTQRAGRTGRRRMTQVNHLGQI